MTDLLVKLYDLPMERPVLPEGVEIRSVMAAEVSLVAGWIEEDFSKGWADEFTRAAHMTPVGSFIAVSGQEILGFSCFDAAGLGLFGPTGVAEKERGRRLGALLLFAALDAMVAKGYVYAIIGGVGPVDFYVRTVGASRIEGSENRYFSRILKPRDA